jgi:hypothetical protein
VDDVQNSEISKTVGSFELNPVKPNNYWYNGKSYEYNEYEIQITSWPVKARIMWNGKLIGTTPFLYKFSGTLERDDRVVVQALPVDENLKSQEGVFVVREELPREIKFDFKNKQ